MGPMASSKVSYHQNPGPGHVHHTPDVLLSPGKPQSWGQAAGTLPGAVPCAWWHLLHIPERSERDLSHGCLVVTDWLSR